jgi:hypothetical protein
MLARPRIIVLLALVGTAVSGQTGIGRQGSIGPAPALTAHEWGTFTSVAGPDGGAVEWLPFDGPSDLPGFVTILNPSSIKTGPRGYLPTVRATVRMETPVIYFYADQEQTVSVRVRFPHGLITEWYPQASVAPVVAPTPLAKATGDIAWNEVLVSPFPRGEFPVEPGASHYYAARDTDASPVQVGSQHEKFLFYRGLASFPVPVSALVRPDRTIAVANSGGDGMELYVLFERRGERLGYRILRDRSRDISIARPALDGDFASLREDLENLLVEQGLHVREAAAMVETWRDSWFEEGTRLFYMVPRPSVDAILPLEISPRPADLVRVFVGRLEIITPELLTEVQHALASNDAPALRKHGRFLEPIVQSLARNASSEHRARMNAALDALAAR